jgi:hypothetical protein
MWFPIGALHRRVCLCNRESFLPQRPLLCENQQGEPHVNLSLLQLKLTVHASSMRMDWTCAALPLSVP